MRPALPKRNQELDIDEDVLDLAKEIRRNGMAVNPETPAFIREVLGVPLPLAATPVRPGNPSKVIEFEDGAYLKVKTGPAGGRRYELAFQPINNPDLIAWGRFWRRIGRIRILIVAVLLGDHSRPAGVVDLPPLGVR